MVGHTSYGMIQRLHNLLARAEGDEQSDRDLLSRFADQADADAFAAIVRRHGPMVLGICRRLLDDWADADDAFQATFAILIRKAASLSHPQQLAGWLFQVAYRTARRARAGRLRRQSRQVPLHEIPVEAPVADFVWRELRPIFDEEINRLPDKLRLPVVLCYLEGRTKLASAQALGWPEGTFSCRLQQARELLQARLARRGVTASAAALTTALAQASASAVVPASLISSTVESASLIAAGSAATAPVAALTQGVLHSMFMTKLKIVAALTLSIGVLGGGTGWVLRDGAGGRAAAQQPGDNRSQTKGTGVRAAPADETPSARFEEPPPIVPDKQLAKDNESVVIETTDGRQFAGVIKFEDANEVRILTADGKLVTIKRDDIEEVRPAKNATPERAPRKDADPELNKPLDRAQVPWANKLFVPKDTHPVVVHEFGTVPWGKIVTHRFTFTNIYAVPIQIMEAPRVSCGCVRIIRYTDKQVAPLESGSIEVEMDARRFEGPKAVSIQISFGPRYQSTAMLQVRAVSRADGALEPNDADPQAVKALILQFRLQLEELLINYGDSHPEVIAVRKKIERLKELLASRANASNDEKDPAPAATSQTVTALLLLNLDLQLQELLIKYGESHPNVISLRKRIETVKELWASSANDGKHQKNAPPANREEPELIQELPNSTRVTDIDAKVALALIQEEVARVFINAAENHLAEREIKVDQLKKLVAKGFVAKAVLDQAIADAKVATDTVNLSKARLKRAEANVEQARKRASEAPAPAANENEPLPAPRTVKETPPKWYDVELFAAQLLERDARIDVRNAETDFFTNLQTKVDRLKKLVADGTTVAQPSLDEAVADMRVAGARLRQAKARLQRAQATLNQLNQFRPQEAKDPAAANRKDISFKDAEAHLERLEKLKASGAVAEAEVDRARIVVAEARIVAELRTVVQLRQKEIDRARQLLSEKLIAEENFKTTAEALDSAKRRLSEAKLIMEDELRKVVDALDAAKRRSE